MTLPTIAQDSFVRANQSGLGTASDGQVWSILSGNGVGSIASNEGVITGPTTLTFAQLGSGTAADQELLVRTACPDTSTNAAGLALRITASNTAYRVRLNANSAAQGIGIIRTSAGTSTNLVTASFTATVGTFYWVRGRIVGTSIWAKAWADGTAEPAAWTITTTDATITGAGGVGLCANSSSGASAIKYDGFYATLSPFVDTALVSSESSLETVALVPSESVTQSEQSSSTVTQAFTDTLTTTDAPVPTLAQTFTDTFTIVESITGVSASIGLVETSQLTVTESVLWTETASLVDITTPGIDRLAQVLPFAFTDNVTSSDILSPTLAVTLPADTMSTAEAIGTTESFTPIDTLTEVSSMTYWSQPLFITLVDDALTPSDLGFFYPRTVNTGYTLVGTDSFGRPNSAGSWGIATDTTPWTYIRPAGATLATLAISSQMGTIINASNDSIMVLGQVSGDADIYARMTPTNTGDVFGLLARLSNAGGTITAYKLLFFGASLNINKTVSGTTTNIASLAFTVSAGTAYQLHFRAIGSLLAGKIWVDGTAEPAAWTVITTDSSITGTGLVGVLGNTATGVNTVGVDRFFAVDNLPLDAISVVDASSFTATAPFIPDSAPPLSDSLVATVIWPFTDSLTPGIDTIVFGTPVPLPDVPLAIDETIISVNSGNQGWLTLGRDTFVRANQSGSWGTASDGNTWSVASGTPTQAIASNEGTLTNISALTFMQIGSDTAADAEGSVRTLSVSSSMNAGGVALRLSGNTAYRARINPNAPTQGFAIIRTVSGTSTTLISSAFTATVGTFYWIRFRVTGTTLLAKIWADGTAEPAAWTLSTTDATITAAGGVGIVAGSSSTADVFKFDTFLAYDQALADVPLGETEVNYLTVQSATADSVTELETVLTTLVQPFPSTPVVETEILTPLLVVQGSDTLALTEAFSSVNIANGIVGLDVLTLLESVTYVVNSVPVEVLGELETAALTLTYPLTIEQLSQAETTTLTVIAMTTDQLSSSDTIAQVNFADIPVETIGIPVETVLFTVLSVSAEGPALSLVETEAQSLFFSVAETSTTDDNLTYGVPSTFPVDMVTIAAEIFMVRVEQLELDASGELETVLFTEQQGGLLDMLAGPTESGVPTVIALLVDSSTTTDGIIAGVPAPLFDLALAITETGAFGDGNTYALGTDQLTIAETFFTLNNFTDVSVVQESLLSTVQSVTLDPRSVLYSNIIADGPTVYYQLNEDTFAGLYQRNGQDEPRNASNPSLLGATLEYTWAQIEPLEGDFQWSLIDADILPWQNQEKSVILRIFPASTVARNSVSYFANTAGQATPQWVFDAGAPAIVGFDGSVYPVYWNAVYQAKYAAFISEFATRYDTNAAVAGVVIASGVSGTTTLEASGDSVFNTIALWTPRGYTAQQWVTAISWTIGTYQAHFLHTSLMLSVTPSFLAPDTIYNVDQVISQAVAAGVWLMDESVAIGKIHTNPNWNVVPSISIPGKSAASGGDSLAAQLVLENNYQSDYACIWADDVTDPKNVPLLASYATAVLPRRLTDSATGSFVMPTTTGVYPTAHIQTGDYLNGAQQFNGLSGYGTIAASPQTGVTAWTMKASIFPTSLPTSEAIILCNGQGGIVVSGGYGLGISGGSSGGPGSNLCAYLPGIGWIDSGYAFPAINTWYACFAVFDGTTLSFYVNGVQTALTSTQVALPVQSRLTVGALWDGYSRTANRLFIGAIDEAALYNYALSPSRIAMLASIEGGMVETLAGSANIAALIDTVTISDSASLFTPGVALIDTALTTVDTFAFSQGYIIETHPLIEGSDTFVRPNQSGWGTASDGQNWNVLAGSLTASIVANQGSVTGNTAAWVSALGTGSYGLSEGIVRVKLNNPSGTAGLMLRVTDGVNYYRARIANNFAIVRSVAGTATDLVTATFTYTAGTEYWIRFKAQASTLSAKVWVAGTTEPVAWTISVTDATFATGKIGLYTKLNATSDIVTYDNFYVIDTALSDQVVLTESYTFTAVLPPFVETLGVLDVLLSIPAVSSTDAVTLAETMSLTGNATGIDFDAFVEHDALVVAVNLVDAPLVTAEKLFTPIARILLDDALTLSDVSSFTAIGGAPAGQLAPSDSVAWALAAAFTEITPPADASTLTMQRFFVDTTLTTSDSSALTGVFLERSTVVSVETVLVTPVFSPVGQSLSTDKLLVFTVLTLPLVALSLSETVLIRDELAALELLPETEGWLSYSAVALSGHLVFIPSDTLVFALVTAKTDGLSVSETDVAALAITLVERATIPVETALPILSEAVSDVVTSLEGAAFADAVTLIDITQLSLSDTLAGSVTLHPTEQLSTGEALALASTSFLLEGIVPGEVTALTITTHVPGIPLSSTEQLTTLLLALQRDTAFVTDTVQTVLAQAQTDALSVQELVGSSIALASTNTVITSEALSTQTVFVVPGVYPLFESLHIALIAFSVEQVVQAEQLLTMVMTQAEHYTLALAPSVFTGLLTFLPTIAVTVAESVTEVLRLTLPADVLGLIDASTTSKANSFTGFLDVSSLVEKVAYQGTYTPITSELLVESSAFSESEVLRENTLPFIETFVLVLGQTETEQGVIAETLVPTSTIKETVQLTELETSLFIGGIRDSSFTPITDTSRFDALWSTPEQNTEHELLLATASRTFAAVTLPQSEQTLITDSLVPIERLSFLDRATYLLAESLLEMTPVSDKAPMLGFSLTPDSLSISDKLNYTRTTFEVVTAQTVASSVQVILLTGQVTAVIDSGSVEGVIP